EDLFEKEEYKDIFVQSEDSHELYPETILYEDSNVKVVRLETEEQACYFGKGTRWCTAAKENNMFSHYNEQGKLYVIVDKIRPKTRYQLHHGEGVTQIMDIHDDPVGLKELSSAYPQIFSENYVNFYYKKIYFNYNRKICEDKLVRFHNPSVKTTITNVG